MSVSCTIPETADTKDIEEIEDKYIYKHSGESFQKHDIDL